MQVLFQKFKNITIFCCTEIHSVIKCSIYCMDSNSFLAKQMDHWVQWVPFPSLFSYTEVDPAWGSEERKK